MAAGRVLVETRGDCGLGGRGEGGGAEQRRARDGGAEQRPLARSLLRLCQRHALCPSTERA